MVVLMVQWPCNRVNGVSVSATLPLVSALCSFSERVRTQCYIHFYFKMSSTHNIVMTSCVCLHLAPTLHLTNCHKPGICSYDSDASLGNCRGRQIAQNANFYIMLLLQQNFVNIMCQPSLERHYDVSTKVFFFQSVIKSYIYNLRDLSKSFFGHSSVCRKCLHPNSLRCIHETLQVFIRD